MKGSIKVLKEQPQGSVDGLLNALRQVDVATALAVPVLRHYALSVPANVAVPVSCCACAFFAVVAMMLVFTLLLLLLLMLTLLLLLLLLITFVAAALLLSL